MFGLRYDNLMDLCLALITATQRPGLAQAKPGLYGEPFRCILTQEKNCSSSGYNLICWSGEMWSCVRSNSQYC